MFPPSIRLSAHIARPVTPGRYPAALEALGFEERFAAADAAIRSWPGYAATPLRSLDRLAADLGIAAVHYKDESGRFGLGSFKALGGAYAVLCVVADVLRARTGEVVALEAVRAGEHAAAASDITVCSATDGNHGRSVAWGASNAGCACRIYIHRDVSAEREAAIAAFGAEVVRVDGDYDESVHACAQEAASNGWYVVSDTSYDGYTDVPRQVMAGYSVLSAEVGEVLGDNPPTHVFLQAGVGGLAAAIAAEQWLRWGERRPRVVIVESEHAACLLESARTGGPSTVDIAVETLMAGLSCGEVSLVAWDVLARAASHFVTIPDECVAPTMRLLHQGHLGDGAIEGGECATPGIIALAAAMKDDDVRSSMALDAQSTVLVLGCEGATDKVLYEQLLREGKR